MQTTAMVLGAGVCALQKTCLSSLRRRIGNRKNLFPSKIRKRLGTRKGGAGAIGG
jgi:hypothetical protein